MKIDTAKLESAIRKAKLQNLGDYRDDGEICLTIGITLEGETERFTIECCWIVPDFYAELIYACKGPQFEEERIHFATYIADGPLEQATDAMEEVEGDLSQLNDESQMLIRFLQKFAI